MKRRLLIHTLTVKMLSASSGNSEHTRTHANTREHRRRCADISQTLSRGPKRYCRIPADSKGVLAILVA
jgi:hypothetical protein